MNESKVELKEVIGMPEPLLDLVRPVGSMSEVIQCQLESGYSLRSVRGGVELKKYPYCPLLSASASGSVLSARDANISISSVLDCKLNSKFLAHHGRVTFVHYASR